MKRSGTSVLLVEQNNRMALEVCSRAYVFEVGRIAFDGLRGELIEDPRIKKVYLGERNRGMTIADSRFEISD